MENYWYENCRLDLIETVPEQSWKSAASLTPPSRVCSVTQILIKLHVPDSLKETVNVLNCRSWAHLTGTSYKGYKNGTRVSLG